MKAISFLGPTNYTSTTYYYEGKGKETPYFVEALAHFFPDLERIFILLTQTVANPPEGKPRNWDEVKKRLGARVEQVVIPEGHSSNDLWEIFNQLTNVVQDNDTVIFDITHSFRSLPFLTFLAAAYLRTARQIKLHKILYGAFEAKNEHNRTPVFDLTPFVGLLDWITATNQFIYTGNARYLARQLEKQGGLEELVTTVDKIALGLQLLRPQEVISAAHDLPEHLKAATETLPAPFALLSDRLSSSYGQFGLPPDVQPSEQLARQLSLINWYHQTGQYVHALSLGREWLISLLCAHFGVDMQDKNERDEMELLLNGGKIKDPETGDVLRVSKYLEQWEAVPGGKRLRQLWSNQPYQLANLRNDVLHSGFRKNPKSAREIVNLVQNIVQELNAIAAQWGITYNSSEVA